MSRVLVTPIAFGKNDPDLWKKLESSVEEVIRNPKNRPLTAEELLKLIGGVDGYIAGVDEINADVIRAGGNLKIISRFGVGVDKIDLPEATLHGIAVTNTPGANSTAVGEMTVGLMLALARQLCIADKETRSGNWPMLSGVSLYGKTVGLVGFGYIGRAVAKCLCGFGIRILAYDPYISKNVGEAVAVEMTSLDDLLRESDFVSLHLTANPSTFGMVNKDFLTKMKQGSYLVNTARGELVDEQALVQSLKDNHLRGAAIDCFTHEPFDPKNELAHLPQVILTPHTASHADEAIRAMGEISLASCLAVLRGERPLNLLNPEMYG